MTSMVDGFVSRRLRERPNLVSAPREHRKPPIYPTPSNKLYALRSRVLRFLDLQAGTIWDDVASEAPAVSGTVVDVGCGMQPFRSLFGRDVTYIGIDREETRCTFNVCASDTRYYSGDRWPIEDNFADFILCTETFEHVLDPKPFLAEMVRCLKPGGRVLLTVPFAGRWHFIPHDYWRPTPSALAHVLAEAGLTNVGVYGRGNQLTVACYKGMAVVFSLLQSRATEPSTVLASRALGALGMPLALGLAIVANASTRWPGAVDFIGLTATAEKPR